MHASHTQLHVLDQKYRCSARILSAAVGVVTKNQNRHPKRLRPTKSKRQQGPSSRSLREISNTE